MAFDFLKPLRRCFLCKGKKQLLRVEEVGYNTRFWYYHEDCYQTVLRNPEQFSKVLDIAIEITDQLSKISQNEIHNQHVLEERIQKLRNVTISGNVGISYTPMGTMTRDRLPILVSEPVTKLLEKQKNEVQKDKSNKFKKIFKKE